MSMQSPQLLHKHEFHSAKVLASSKENLTSKTLYKITQTNESNGFLAVC